MSFFCRIGLHRWSFASQLLDEPEHLRQTEFVRARCTRHGCARYSAWRLVHRETRATGQAAPGTPLTTA